MSPDIALCRNQDCPLNNTCYRFLAKPNKDWQSYGDFKYILHPTKRKPRPIKDKWAYEIIISCEHYWPVETKPKKK